MHLCPRITVSGADFRPGLAWSVKQTFKKSEPLFLLSRSRQDHEIRSRSPPTQ
jgi:hypothetical protein